MRADVRLFWMRADGFGQPCLYSSVCRDLLSIAHTDARRLPNFLLILCVARRRLLQVHEYLSRTRTAHSELLSLSCVVSSISCCLSS